MVVIQFVKTVLKIILNLIIKKDKLLLIHINQNMESILVI